MKNWEAWFGRPFMETEFCVMGEDSGFPNGTGVGWHWFKYDDNDP